PASVTVRRRRARSALSLRATLGVPSAATCMRIRVGAATPGISRLSSAGSRTSGGAWLIENATEPSGDTRQPTASIAGWSRARTAMPPSTSAVPKPPRSLPLSSYSTMPATSNARRYWMPSMMGAGVRPASVIRITPSSSTMSMRRAVMRSWSGASTRVCGVREAMMRSSVCTEGRFGAASLADAGRAVQSAAKTNGTAAACFKGILCSVGGCDAMSQGYASRATTGIRRQQAEPGGTRRGDGLKPGSEYTFLRAAWLRRPSDPGRAGAASQLALDGLAEAVVAENVLALERRADLPDFVRVQPGDDQRAVGGSACRVVGAERAVTRVGLDQRVGRAARVGGVARPRVIRRIGHHPGAHRVELDVPVAPQQVVVAVDQAGLVAAFPQGAGAAVAVVDVADVAPAEGLHEARQRRGLLRGQQQVHVVGHQHVRMHMAAQG